MPASCKDLNRLMKVIWLEIMANVEDIGATHDWAGRQVCFFPVTFRRGGFSLSLCNVCAIVCLFGHV